MSMGTYQLPLMVSTIFTVTVIHSLTEKGSRTELVKFNVGSRNSVACVNKMNSSERVPNAGFRV